MQPRYTGATVADATTGVGVPALQLRGVQRVFRQGGVDLAVLNGVDLVLMPGEIVALVGPSGAGKSTLLHVAGLLERPDGGAVIVAGEECGNLPDERRTELRRRALGFVYQYHHLLPEFSALENVMLPQMIAGVARGVAREKAAGLLERVGLSARLSHRPARLSGGEQQRVAIVRALANDPKILLADEPTGNLDSRTSIEILGVFQTLNDRGITIAMVTHELDIAQFAKRTIIMRDGQVVNDQPVEDRHSAVEEIKKLELEQQTVKLLE